MKPTNDQIIALLKRRVKDVVGREELEKKIRLGKKVRVKFGVDVARPDIHLGHAVALRKLKEFQDLGHDVIFLIGDATTRIGDPTGRDKTRPFLTEKEIKNNAKTYIDQAAKILNPKKTEVRRNSEWFDKMSMLDFVKLMTMVTHSQLIEREAFQKRISEGKEIFAHELIYPIMQGYDSVVLKADVAVHADQLFNEHFGRMLQEKFGQSPQAIMTIPLLVGLDGKNKMSKSLDNYIGITESPNNTYGKIMSMPDGLIADYFNLCTNATEADIKNIKKDLAGGKTNPRDLKMRLARAIVAIYHGEESAGRAEKNFIGIFQKKTLPEKMPTIVIASPKKISDILLDEKIVSSMSELRRLIKLGGIKIDGETIWDHKIELRADTVIKIGKLKFLKIKFGK